MKTFIKIILLISLFVYCVGISAQYKPKKRFTSDIYAGVNLAEMDIGGKGNNTYKQAKVGLHIGFNLNYKILWNLQVQTGFLVTKKGLKRHVNTVTKDESINEKTTYDEWSNTTGNYIQIPLNLGYEVYFTKTFAVNINGGFYAAYGYKGKGTFSSISVREDGYGAPVETIVPEYEYDTYTPDRWRRFDYGLNGSVGLIYDIYTFKINYEYGLYNISHSDPELRNRNFSASVGFRF
ncbi:PorT family protein [Dysgonomonas sp. 521]|uniref:outer membrane beta-barrel protein n=1 Tax=Dysgonomonas sp. 521 TaxID=2302932 RepID=UPI0013D13083|nr:outer membrane beta-barrel protein [Dysgonomonas sp. 521]NDV94973.1 PorT family protein [Dysgonomonas sp. 521]